MNNKAAWLTGIQNIEIGPAEMPVPDDGELLIKVSYCGICGSDMHFFETGCYSKGPISFPHILGHECAGQVIALGKKTTGFAVGDRVAVEPGVACGMCPECKSGHYNLCKSVQFKSVPPYHGVLRTYITHNYKRCFKLPDHVTDLEGAMVEPFSIGLHAAKRAGVKKGDPVAILGAGCIGMMTLLACRSLGAETAVVADLADFRLEKAARMGAAHVVNSRQEDAAARISELTGGHGADVVFETAGSPVTLAMTPRICKSAGVIMMVGNIFKPVMLDVWAIAHREIDLRGIYRYCDDYPTAISLIADGKVDFTEMITNIYDFNDVQHAFMASILDKEHTLKGVIKL